MKKPGRSRQRRRVTQQQRQAILKNLSAESRRWWLKRLTPSELSDRNLLEAIAIFDRNLEARMRRWKAGLIQIFKKSPKRRPRTRTTRTTRR